MRLFIVILLCCLPLCGQYNAFLSGWAPATGSEWVTSCPPGPQAKLMHVESSNVLFADTRLTQAVTGSLGLGEFDLVYGPVSEGITREGVEFAGCSSSASSCSYTSFQYSSCSGAKVLGFISTRSSAVNITSASFAGLSMTELVDGQNGIGMASYWADTGGLSSGEKTFTANGSGSAGAWAIGLYQFCNASPGAPEASELAISADPVDVTTIQDSLTTIGEPAYVVSAVAARASATPPILTTDQNLTGKDGEIRVASQLQFATASFLQASAASLTLEWDSSFGTPDDMVMASVSIASGGGTETGCEAFVRLPDDSDPNESTVMLGGPSSCCIISSGIGHGNDQYVLCESAARRPDNAHPKYKNIDGVEDTRYEYWLCSWDVFPYLRIHGGSVPWRVP